MFCSVLLGEGADQSGRSAVNSSIQSWSIFTCPYRNCSVIKEQQILQITKFTFFSRVPDGYRACATLQRDS